ncbi:MAG: beta-lysine N6-acetyltransferase [Thermoanaerobacter sp.]|uniref:putative beta-lysine N-acetyltransferase n=1 Tax=Desulfofundulus thermocisternus TaxID=42471 RepID=UPI0004867469|nr:putative beta-lysine N-acetyltransferase [Desulfofundulus thermocisternus]MDK2889190.1 beta-lysine N6-acetyltransferase [Thermoanaerobacter sp.]
MGDRMIRHYGPDFWVSARLDQTSERIWVIDYQAGNPAALRSFLKKLALRRGMGKIIFPVKSGDLLKIQGGGFHVEGMIDGYFQGGNAYFLAAFPRAERRDSRVLNQEQKVLQEILACKKDWRGSLPPGFTLRQAGGDDIFPMARLFKKVFRSYPTPVYDPFYLACSMKKGDLFMVVYHGDRLASVAAAEIQCEHRRAELTNCATDPAYRGMGLNSLLLLHIEKQCLERNINCLYSLARASSYGMNLVLHRLGYVFRGTLINNCHIDGGFENMNIWVRPVK